MAGRTTKTGSSGRSTRTMRSADLREGQLAERIKQAVNAAIEQVAEDTGVDIAEVRRIAKAHAIIG